MLRGAALTRHHSDCYILAHTRPEGGPLGSYEGIPIAPAIVDDFGRRYVYAGLAPRRPNGRFNLDALRRGEWILPPGLVYRCDLPSRPANRSISWIARLRGQARER